MTLGDIIKQYREKQKISMDTFSEKSGISKAYISLLEKNKHPKTGKPIAPSIKYIKQVADAIGMDFNDLFNMIDGNVILNEKSDLIEDREKLSKESTPLNSYNFYASSEEQDVIIAYRSADEIDKTIVRRTLKLDINSDTKKTFRVAARGNENVQINEYKAKQLSIDSEKAPDLADSDFL